MIDEGSTKGCQFYGIDSGLMYGKNGAVVGVEDCNGNEKLCAGCDFRFSCGVKE